jgi:hypothetical protein
MKATVLALVSYFLTFEQEKYMSRLSDSTHNATKHFSKETPSFENSVMDERNNLCFGIVCCHGFLVPDKKATGRRALVGGKSK